MKADGSRKRQKEVAATLPSSPSAANQFASGPQSSYINPQPGQLNELARSLLLSTTAAEMTLKMVSNTYTVHSSLLFDPKKKAFIENVSITVDPATGAITDVVERQAEAAVIQDGDIDLRGKVVMPGFVDAHTHIFLHAYW